MHDLEAEFDSPRTIQAIASAIESYGHTVVPLEATPDLPRALAASGVDVVFNIAEGRSAAAAARRRCRRSASCSASPYSRLGRDHALARPRQGPRRKQILRAAGIETAEWQVVTTGREKLKPFRYPVIVKPNAEGTSKGITSASVVKDEAAARAAAKQLVDRYHQPALIEEYITGREFTVGLLGETAAEGATADGGRLRRPARLPRSTATSEKQSDTPRVLRVPRAAHAVGAPPRREGRARHASPPSGAATWPAVDLRMTKDGKVYVIEINPLPGLTPDFRRSRVIAKVVRMDYRMLIGEILAGCLKRYRDARAATAPRPAFTAAPPAAAPPRPP